MDTVMPLPIYASPLKSRMGKATRAHQHHTNHKHGHTFTPINPIAVIPVGRAKRGLAGIQLPWMANHKATKKP